MTKKEVKEEIEEEPEEIEEVKPKGKKEKVELTEYNYSNKDLYKFPGRYVLYTEKAKDTYLQIFASDSLKETQEQALEESVDSGKKAYIHDRSKYEFGWHEIFDPEGND